MILITFEPIYPGFSGCKAMIIKKNLCRKPGQQFFFNKHGLQLEFVTKSGQKVPKSTLKTITLKNWPKSPSKWPNLEKFLVFDPS